MEGDWMRFGDKTSLMTMTAALAVLATCWLVATPAFAEDIPAAAQEEAKSIFAMRCATCHGTAGHGDGAAAVAMNPKPRSFADGEWQKSVTDAHIEQIIVGGGPAVGKSPLMPPNPDIASKTDVVKALRAMVRGFAPQ
jgi:mono/diheme cytochrome c family protein